MSKRNLSQMLLLMLLLGCANGSSDSGSAAATSPSGEIIKGSIKSVTGSQSEMNQWILALVERDTGIAHSGVINAIGNYTIEGVDTSVAYTLVLLDPQYRFSAVLTYAGLNPGQVRQYFAIGENRLPTLVHNGPIINFTDFSSIAWEKNEAADANGNLIPDAMEASAGLAMTPRVFAGAPGLAGTATTADTDADGLTNDVDGDIDGDGLPNWFDPDDDNDAVPDAFDTDANADEVVDLSQDLGDQYFPRLVKFLALQLVQDVQSDGSLASTLMFTLRLLEDEIATSVLVKGSSTLFTDAAAVQFDPNTGEATLSSWDQTLLDDGNNEDGEAGDGIFTRRVQLASTAVPKANQVFFVEVTQGAGDTRMVHEFPFTFPSMVTGVITGAYTSDTRKVTMTGSPFGTVTDYHWSVHVYDANGIKVFASEPIAGSSTTYTLPTGATDEGETYTARIVATAIDRIPSFPSWVMRSASFNLQ
ncbi:choice-of-anchor X domain-containing protein [Oligoflexus tunisiensis]|uniref:choice-of-anchor X domain-containing protein n=1 Tax=Oligoflexus tunisiensis TaxID=708132 RepID=UPI00114CDE56|nr:choice-of-anchor X domain-containing protein [Oligoflexus tunisiensis]